MICNTILGCESFVTLITIINEMIRKVLALHVIPDVRLPRVAKLLTDGTGVLPFQAAGHKL